MTSKSIRDRSPPSKGLNESWRPVVGFETTYEISNRGRILSRSRGRKPRLLSQCVHTNGYFSVILYDKEIKRHRRYIHRLVAGAFLGVCPDGHCVNHIDGVKTNNHLENLEYLTIAENTRHANRIGISCSRSNGRLRSPLKEEDVRAIRRVGKSVRQIDLAARYGVAPGTIRDIQARRVWKLV